MNVIMLVIMLTVVPVDMGIILAFFVMLARERNHRYRSENKICAHSHDVLVIIFLLLI